MMGLLAPLGDRLAMDRIPFREKDFLMRRYASARLRSVLLMGLIGMAVLAIATPGFAQTAGAGDATTPTTPLTVFQLVMQNRDPVFYTIVVLSVIGLMLIIQGA